MMMTNRLFLFITVAAASLAIPVRSSAAMQTRVLTVAVCCRGGGGHGGGHSGAHASRRSSASRSHSYSPRSYSPRVSSPRSRTTYSYVPRPRSPHAAIAPGARNSHGRLERSAEAKRTFEKQTGHPHGWSGHVIDHRIPLVCGGADAPSNMQWQTVAEGKIKDRTERRGCGR